MVSSTDFANSLTISNASSAHYTLAVMSVVALITLPLILLYQGWTYHVFRQRVGRRPSLPPPVAGPEAEPLLPGGESAPA
jgi:cytochrome bd-type quinol oxidase subunit 2